LDVQSISKSFLFWSKNVSEHRRLYQRALYYDIALGRTVEREADFILAVYQQICGQPLQSVLDMACGPGYHACALAQRRVRTWGLDLQPEMLQLARQRAAEAGVEPTLLQCDMRSFQMPQPVQMTVCMFDGLDALCTDEDLIQHFAAVREALLPGGLYLVDLCHPRDTNLQYYMDFHYQGERDGVWVEVFWRPRYERFVWTRDLAFTELEIHVRDHGEEQSFFDTSYERLFTPGSLRLLAHLGGLEDVAWFGDYDLKQPLDGSAASQRMIGVFQRSLE